MKIEVIGTGCPKCKKLGELAQQIAEELGVEYEIEKVTDLSKIVELGVTATPALAIDGEVVLVGRVPSYEKLKEIIGTISPPADAEDRNNSNCDL